MLCQWFPERSTQREREGHTHLDSVDDIKSPRIGQIKERLADDLLGEFEPRSCEVHLLVLFGDSIVHVNLMEGTKEGMMGLSGGGSVIGRSE